MIAKDSYLRDRCCENNDFIKLADTFHELVNTWPFYHIDVVILPFDFNRNREVRLM
jgi:hypothetical protein